MHKYRRTDFIETNLKQALQDGQSDLVGLVQATRAQFERHKARLQVVREEKEKARLEMLGT